MPTALETLFRAAMPRTLRPPRTIMAAARPYLYCAATAFLMFGSVPAAACPALAKVAGSRLDATSVLLDCIRRTPVGGLLELPAARYTLRTQLRIVKPIRIRTAGIAGTAPNCHDLPAGKCATLTVDLDGAPNPNIMPIEMVAKGVSVSHLIFEGTGGANVVAACKSAYHRPLGGGMRVLGSQFAIRKSVLRNFTCYTTMEVLDRAKTLTIEDNRVGPNGDHRPGDIWTDGITIHDSADSIVRRNVFVDNTDVQLIFGGCQRCKIQDNVFFHTGRFSGASFAEIMLQAFPSTTGNYVGTVVSGNKIDCRRKHLCGYGIMIGANPWKAGENPRYPGAMFGGAVVDNTIANALIGINIDSPTGSVVVDRNKVSSSGGRYASDCGIKNWPAVNIAPGAARYVKGDPSQQKEGSVRTTSCIVNRRSE